MTSKIINFKDKNDKRKTLEEIFKDQLSDETLKDKKIDYICTFGKIDGEEFYLYQYNQSLNCAEILGYSEMAKYCILEYFSGE